MNDENESILNKYMHDVGKYDLLSPDEERELFEQMHEGIKSDGRNRKAKKRGREARERLIQSNLRLVVKIAKSFRNIGLDYEDLVNEGNIGLITAVDKFKPEKGAKLSYYSSFWIKQCIRRAISNKGRTIRLPVAVVDLKLKIYKYIEKFESKNMRKPSSQEVSDALEIPLVKVNKLLKLSLQSESLNKLVNDNNKELGGLIHDGKMKDPYRTLSSRASTKF